MAGRAPSSASAPAIRARLSAAPRHGTTAKDRFGRSKPVVTRTGLAQPQARDDVRRDLRGRRGGRGHERPRAQPARRVGEAEVVRAEVVAPLRDAVRLVDDEQPHVRGLERLGEARRGEALGRDVEQAHLAGGGPLHHGAVGAGVLLGVDHGGAPRGHALEPLDLVLHQGHERRDDHRQVVSHQRRQLVAQRLPRAGGHDHEHVVRRAGTRQRPHGLGLPGAEGLEAEERSQCGVGGVHGGRPTIAARSAGTAPRGAACAMALRRRR